MLRFAVKKWLFFSWSHFTRWTLNEGTKIHIRIQFNECVLLCVCRNTKVASIYNIVTNPYQYLRVLHCLYNRIGLVRFGVYLCVRVCSRLIVFFFYIHSTVVVNVVFSFFGIARQYIHLNSLSLSLSLPTSMFVLTPYMLSVYLYFTCYGHSSINLAYHPTAKAIPSTQVIISFFMFNLDDAIRNISFSIKWNL